MGTGFPMLFVQQFLSVCLLFYYRNMFSYCGQSPAITDVMWACDRLGIEL